MNYTERGAGTGVVEWHVSEGRAHLLWSQGTKTGGWTGPPDQLPDKLREFMKGETSGQMVFSGDAP